MNITKCISNIFKHQVTSSLVKRSGFSTLSLRKSPLDVRPQMKQSEYVLQIPKIMTCQRQFSALNNQGSIIKDKESEQFLTSYQPSLVSIRTYKAKGVLRLRCKGCFFERREGRLYVECTLKQRHRQMKKIANHKLYRDDYSKGKVWEATWWQFKKNRFYGQGKTAFTNYNWLGDRLGKQV